MRAKWYNFLDRDGPNNFEQQPQSVGYFYKSMEDPPFPVSLTPPAEEVQPVTSYGRTRFNSDRDNKLVFGNRHSGKEDIIGTTSMDALDGLEPNQSLIIL